MKSYEFVVTRRKQLGISQRELAGMIKRLDGDGSISPQLMNCIEHGRRPYKPYMQDLAKALQVDELVLACLIGYIPEKYRALPDNLDNIPKAYYAFWQELHDADN